MRISDVVGLLAALIGSTATLLATWAYIRSQHPPKRELLRTTLAITFIMGCILGLAVLISRATTITVNGRESVPIPPLFPNFPTPANPSSSPASSSPTPSPSPTPSSSSTSSPSPTPSPSSTLSPSPTPSSPSPTPSHSP